MTASAIYDAIEPIIIWRTFFHALERHDTSLLRWTLAYIPQKDDEVFGIHIPIVLDHILQKTVSDSYITADPRIRQSTGSWLILSFMTSLRLRLINYRQKTQSLLYTPLRFCRKKPGQICQAWPTGSSAGYLTCR